MKTRMVSSVLSLVAPKVASFPVTFSGNLGRVEGCKLNLQYLKTASGCHQRDGESKALKSNNFFYDFCLRQYGFAFNESFAPRTTISKFETPTQAVSLAQDGRERIP